jgi:hypothetical protein
MIYWHGRIRSTRNTRPDSLTAERRCALKLVIWRTPRQQNIGTGAGDVQIEVFHEVVMWFVFGNLENLFDRD